MKLRPLSMKLCRNSQRDEPKRMGNFFGGSSSMEWEARLGGERRVEHISKVKSPQGFRVKGE
eukprot:c14095_g2_i1 orf=260-445(+)